MINQVQSSNKKVLTIIDTFGFFFRSYYALPPLKNRDGFPTGLLKGFMDLIYSIGRDYHSDYLVFALDSKGDTFRKEIDPNYKANRAEAPEDLLKQLPIAIDWIKMMGFYTYSATGFEADDIIASLSSFAKEHDIIVRVVSHDKDLYQLIEDEFITLYDPQKKIIIDTQKCYDKFGVYPNQFIDYQSIVGDSADNVPGVKGIGAKGAQKLLTEYKTLDGIYKNIDFVSPKGIQSKLVTSKESAYLSKQLVTLRQDMFDSIDLNKFLLPTINPILAIKDELLEYGLNQIISKVENDGLYIKTEAPKEPEKLQLKAILLDNIQSLHDVVAKIEEGAIVAFDTETTSLDSKSAKIVGFSFSYEDNIGYYVPIAHNYLGVGEQINLSDAKDIILKLFTYKIVGQNIKYDLNILYNNFNFNNLKIASDTMILSWLINPELSASLDNMAKREFSYEMIKFKDVVKKGETFSTIEIDKACEYASEDATITFKLYNLFIKQLDKNLLDIHNNIELPFINTLINVENEGIKLDIPMFEKLYLDANKKIARLTSSIHQISGEEFNINSTQQLSNILFETLGLPKGKKTKTGYSTDEKVLNSLIDSHEIIPMLLDYREIYKLKSTYIEPLLKLAKDNINAKIYTSFSQTGTATGRLSSKNPNLQNIPVRTEVGRKIRDGFIAKDGYKLISIDYSQIELRLLAHFSKDEALVNAFNNNEDIHLSTAYKIFGEEEAKSKRDIAKSINFGLLYGMGSRKLSQELGISAKEAKEYIESYFKSFPTLKDYMDLIKTNAKNDGYVSTLVGRKRIFDYENANSFTLASYDREAVNTVFQGSAADLIKMSMNTIDTTLNKEYANILLQIHDELIIEVRDDKVDEVTKVAQSIMENIYKLDIPLNTSLGIAKSWGELK